MTRRGDAPEAEQKRKRIALFLPSLAGGGAERVALAQAHEIVRRGHQVDLVLIFGGGELLPLVPEGANVVSLEARRIGSALLPLVRYLRRNKPDALQGIMWPSTVVAILAHWIARSKAVLVVNDQVALSQHVRSPWEVASLRLSTRLLYPLANHRIVCSQAAADDLSRLARISRESIEVIYNPIQPPDAIATMPEIERLWGDCQERIITVGSLKDQKNHALLLRAFARLEGHERARLMILGEGALRPELEQLTRDLGISGRVLLPGFATDPWPYYASADLFVLSSDYEGFGNVVTEALYSGLPVVSTDCLAGPAEILGGGEFGRLVPVGDAEALAAAIDEALDDPRDAARNMDRAVAVSGPHTVRRYADLLLAG